MINSSAQIMMQAQNEPKAAPKENKTAENGFFQVFNRSLHAERTNMQKSDTGSRKTKPIETANAPALARKEVAGSYEAASASDPKAPIRQQKSFESDKPLRSVKENTGSAEGSSELPPDLSDREELLEDVENLQAAMDAIIALLQHYASPSAETEQNGSQETAVQTIPLSELHALKQALESKLSELTHTAEQMEGTKTSDTVQQFVDKLQQLLGKDFAQLFGEQEQITIQSSGALRQLIEKMLHETEKVKMHVTENSIQEIVIPVMTGRERQSMQESTMIEALDNADQVSVSAADKTPASTESFLSEQKDSGTEKEFSGQKLPRTGVTEEPKLFPSAANTEAVTIAVEITQEPATNITAAVHTQKIPEAVKPEALVQQVVEKAEALVTNDKSEVIMQLRPESLGKISLKVIHERGEVVASFVAENEQVKSILESNLQLLKDSLQKSGVAVQSLSVSVGQQEQGQNAEPGSRQDSRTGTRRQILETITEQAVIQPTYRYRGLSAEIFQSGRSEINLTA